MRLYHGSAKIIECPDVMFGKENNDYGQGFYCTESSALAKEWACPSRKDGIANIYDLDMENLNVLRLNDSTDTAILSWMAMLVEHRKPNLDNGIANEARRFLLQHFLPDFKGADVIIGYRADDSYFSFARDFLNNTISVEQLDRAMKLGNLGEQVMIRTIKAQDRLQFQGYEIADGTYYYGLRKRRDEDARSEYRKMQSELTISGKYIMDYLREEQSGESNSLMMN